MSELYPDVNGIKAVIFDWAGTAVDYGCFAPVATFINVFRGKGVDITEEEVRKPMGLPKIDHIKALCSMDRIVSAWQKVHGTKPAENDINALYDNFESLLFSILPSYATPIPGVVELVAGLRKRGIAIGSTTGYTKQMITIVSQEAKKYGYVPDCIVTPNDVPAGRPYPFMCFMNAARLGVYPFKSIVKVGDTISDIQEGVNAGIWSVGIIKGGSELGLKNEQVLKMNPSELLHKMNNVRDKFYAAGAHYVIDSITELDKVVELIEEEYLFKGKLPDVQKQQLSC